MQMLALAYDISRDLLFYNLHLRTYRKSCTFTGMLYGRLSHAQQFGLARKST